MTICRGLGKLQAEYATGHRGNADRESDKKPSASLFYQWNVYWRPKFSTGRRECWGDLVWFPFLTVVSSGHFVYQALLTPSIHGGGGVTEGCFEKGEAWSRSLIGSNLLYINYLGKNSEWLLRMCCGILNQMGANYTLHCTHVLQTLPDSLFLESHFRRGNLHQRENGVLNTIPASHFPPFLSPSAFPRADNGPKEDLNMS